MIIQKIQDIMDKQHLHQYILVGLMCFTYVHAASKGYSNSGIIDKIEQFVPGLHHMLDRTLYSEYQEDDTDESDDAIALEKLDMVLRTANIDNTMISDIIKAKRFPNFHNVFDNEFLDALESKFNQRSEIYNELLGHLATMDYSPSGAAFNNAEELNPTGGYDGCKMDYDSLVFPILMRLIELVNGDIPRILIPFNRKRQPWAPRMFDALTKIPTALADGKLHWVGGYEMCESVQVTNYSYDIWDGGLLNGKWVHNQTRAFNGQYCRIGLKPEVPLIGNGSDLIKLQLGVCVPSTCSKENVKKYIESVPLNLIVGLLGLKVESVYCGQETDFDNDPGIQATVGIILTLIILVVIASIYDSYFRQFWADQIINDHVKCINKQAEMAAAQKIRAATPNSVPLSNGDLPPAYHQVDITDRKSFTPLQSQTSVTSLTPLVDDDDYDLIRATSETDKYSDNTESAGILDRLEVVLVGFSARNNLNKVFGYHNAQDTLFPSVNGVRFLSWAIVLYAHTWLYGPVYNESWTTSNLVRVIREYPSNFLFQPIINSHYASDSFLLISGLLVTYYWIERWNKHKGAWGKCVMLLKHYLGKYWQIMPALMCSLMFYTNSYSYLGSGPLFPVEIGDAETCRSNWWIDLLLVHNLVTGNGTCLTWTWFVGLLWQCHIVAPVILFPLVIKPLFGYIAMAVVYVISISVTLAELSRIWDDDDLGRLDWFTDYYNTPWCRIGTYVIGMALGAILHKMKTKKNFKMHWIVVLLMWVVSLVCILSVSYGTYPIFKEGGSKLTKGGSLMYDTFGRTAWALGVCWIIFACETGYAGFIKHFLSWGFFLPLSRITYPSILLHASIIFVFVYGQYDLLYLNSFNVLYWFFAHFWMVHGVGLFFVGLVFYYPISVGVLQAFKVKTKLDCVLSGTHKEFEKQPDTSAAILKAQQSAISNANSNDNVHSNNIASIPTDTSVNEKLQQEEQFQLQSKNDIRANVHDEPVNTYI